MVSLRHTEEFHRKKRMIPNIILSKTDNHEIIYGAQAINKQLPSDLKRDTSDFDIFSRTPKKDAREVERALDRGFGGNYFYVEPAQHKGTFRVKAYANQEGYADYTKPEGKIPNRYIDGKRYVKLGFVKKHIAKTLKDPEARFRHAKDKDALNRIKIHEKRLKSRKLPQIMRLGVFRR